MSRTRAVIGAVSLLVVVAVVALVVTLSRRTTSGSPPSASPTATPSGPRIPLSQRSFFFLGDSLMKGLYASTEAKSWRELVLAESHGKDAGRLGGPGQTVPDVVNQFALANQSHQGEQANTIIIELGTNDVGHKVPTATDKDDYPKLIALARQRAGANATLVCLGAWRPPEEAKAFDATVEPICAKAGGIWLTLSDLYAKGDTIGPVGSTSVFGTRDDLHPNDTGHQDIANRIIDALKAVSP